MQLHVRLGTAGDPARQRVECNFETPCNERHGERPLSNLTFSHNDLFGAAIIRVVRLELTRVSIRSSRGTIDPSIPYRPRLRSSWLPSGRTLVTSPASPRPLVHLVGREIHRPRQQTLDAQASHQITECCVLAQRYERAKIAVKQQRGKGNGTVRGLDLSLKTVSICIVKADGTVVWEGKALSEPASLIKALVRRRRHIQLVGIEACPLSEWLYGALVDSGFTTIWTHATRLSIGRARYLEPHQQMRRQVRAPTCGSR